MYDIGMSMNSSPSVDWPRVVRDLVVAGYTQSAIAKDCSCRQSSISDLACGRTTEPRYSIGAALLKLHAAASGDGRSSAGSTVGSGR